MPTKCSVSGCDNFYSKDVPFFDVPSPVKYKFNPQKSELSKKRRELWLKAMGIKDDSSQTLRVCCKHFVTNKPAGLEESDKIDWIPNLHMKINNNSRQKLNQILGTSESLKVLLDRNVQYATFVGTNGSGSAVSQKHGVFTADNVAVKEAAINNIVLRIHLVRDNLHYLQKNYKSLTNVCTTDKTRKESAISSFGRHLKRRSDTFRSTISNSQKKNIDGKRLECDKNVVSRSTKVEKPLKIQGEKGHKGVNMNSKFQSKQKIMRSVTEDPKTLNKTIKKNFRDKIKIKLFSNIKPTTKKLKTGMINTESNKVHSEVLFVNHFNNELRELNLNKIYYLKFPPCQYADDGMLDYPFEKLVTDVKYMKLPAPSWKIKVIIKQGKISAVTFTNKLELERSVGFFANNDKYKIVIDNKPALLLGSPQRITCAADLEVLLDIVENIDPKSPMILYK